MQYVRKALKIAAITVLAGTILLFFITLFIYQSVFDRRFEADARPLALSMADFPSLTAKPVTFQSSGHTLRGNFYRSKAAQSDIDALLVFCHGFSNGSRDYLAQINYFAQRGFEVLAYDNTGCYASDGKGVRGIPQAVMNLNDVLNALTSNENFASYHQKPLILMGHSWGGYAVNAVLAAQNFDTVRAVVSFSAPNKSQDMLVEQGRHLLGDGIELLRPFIWAVERLKFGRYAGYSALEGVNRTHASVLALHSIDDPVVSYGSSLTVQAPQVINPNAEFRTAENKKHNTVLSGAARAYSESLQKYTDTEMQGRKPSAAELEALLINADKMQLYQLDDEVLKEVFEFIMVALH